MSVALWVGDALFIRIFFAEGCKFPVELYPLPIKVTGSTGWMETELAE